MTRRRKVVLCVGFLFVFLIAFGVIGRGLLSKSSTEAPAFGIGFLGYTNGLAGKRFVSVKLTNLSAQAFRIWDHPIKIDYGPPFNGPMDSWGVSEAILNPQQSIIVTFEVITNPGASRPKMRLMFETTAATRRERLIRGWEKIANQNAWLALLPISFTPVERTPVVTEWFGP